MLDLIEKLINFRTVVVNLVIVNQNVYSCLEFIFVEKVSSVQKFIFIIGFTFSYSDVLGFLSDCELYRVSHLLQIFC